MVALQQVSADRDETRKGAQRAARASRVVSSLTRRPTRLALVEATSNMGALHSESVVERLRRALDFLEEWEAEILDEFDPRELAPAVVDAWLSSRFGDEVPVAAANAGRDDARDAGHFDDPIFADIVMVTFALGASWAADRAGEGGR